MVGPPCSSPFPRDSSGSFIRYQLISSLVGFVTFPNFNLNIQINFVPQQLSIFIGFDSMCRQDRLAFFLSGMSFLILSSTLRSFSFLFLISVFVTDIGSTPKPKPVRRFPDDEDAENAILGIRKMFRYAFVSSFYIVFGWWV